MIEVLVITISKPLLIGIYENKELKEEIKLDELTSEALPILFKNLIKEYDIKSIIYVNTPGSFMSIKIAYIFLKTLCMLKNIEFLAASGFTFNEDSPIKALGKKYFIKTEEGLKVDFLEKGSRILDFKLPQSIKSLKFSKNSLPIYNLPAV